MSESRPLHPRYLAIADYSYPLPDNRIAHHPLARRDGSKLLIWEKNHLSDAHFYDLPNLLPENTTLVLNQSRVIPARLHFVKETGGQIEIFCLEPDARYESVEAGLAQTGEVYWHCLVGGAAKWKTGQVLHLQQEDLVLEAGVVARQGGAFDLHFRWNEPGLSFAEILNRLGALPLPPYMNRPPEAEDAGRYQTVFANQSGSVAAPTASLHFSEQVLQELRQKGMRLAHTLLHVGAGTFQPVKSATMDGHPMHAEWITVDAALVEALLAGLSGTVVAVGTTALRTVESVYWMGCKLAQGVPINFSGIAVEQWEPYESNHPEVPVPEALEALLHLLKTTGKPLTTRTRILIAPGYDFKIARGLITNFHQPHSTLLLLVAAFAGPDWRRLYDHALAHDYRFLSYGDSSLLLR